MPTKRFELLEALCEQELTRPLQSCSPSEISAKDTLEYLWPLNDRFRPRLHQIKTVRYRKQYERAADQAIKDFALKGSEWDGIPLVVWRVLLERHQQASLVCIANIMANNLPLMQVPEELTAQARTKFAVVFLCYAMKLPYKLTDESALDIDSPFEHLSGKLH
ncbi:hypothetical protein AB8896_05190 [Yersinia enterocolitica]|uniref:hypothetical protein n=1 Tax=Yersinia enterocolitica TaxID=630 RepID=UPI002AFAC937|nr:hypothetical protein [Yersinia enterocolitica]